jgi:hypothetical protein
MVMTIDDEIQLQPATSGDGAIVPEGRYTLHLIGLEKAPPSTFKPEDGPRVKWIFHLYAELVDGLEKGAQFMFDGRPYEFWRTTSTKNSKRAYARQYAEALGGRSLEDQEIPKLGKLLDAKMSAMITYDPDPDDATRQLLKMGGLKHVSAPRTTTPVAAPKPSSGLVWPEIDPDDTDRALIVSKIRKSYTRLEKLDPESAKNARKAIIDSDLEESLLDDLNVLSEQISTAVRTAMEMDD